MPASADQQQQALYAPPPGVPPGYPGYPTPSHGTNDVAVLALGGGLGAAMVWAYPAIRRIYEDRFSGGAPGPTAADAQAQAEAVAAETRARAGNPASNPGEVSAPQAAAAASEPYPVAQNNHEDLRRPNPGMPEQALRPGSAAAHLRSWGRRS